jgi:type I restriction enzyme S subunit
MDGKQLRNSILQWAIQGKLVPQDPNDEPASLLLERIREEKARLVKEKKIKRDKNESIIYRGEDNSYYEKFTDGKEICIDEEIPFEVPNGWEWARLSHVTFLIEDCPHSTAKDEGAGYALVRTSNIGFGKLILDGAHRVSENVYNERKARAVPQTDDLIFAREAPAGNIAIIQEGEKVCLGQRTVLLRPMKQYVLPMYLVYYILSPLTQKNLVDKSFGTTVAHVNLSDFRPYLVAIPPKKEQSRIINIIEEILPLVRKHEHLEETLSELNNSISNLIKKSILQEAIRGKLVPQIMEEGTSQELFDQINAEKQKLVNEGKLKKSALQDCVICRGDDNKYWEKRGKEIVCIDDEIPFDIPDSWTWSRLGSIFSHCTGKALNSSNNKGTPLQYITTSNLYWERFELGTLRTMPFTDEELDKCTITKGDLLVCEGGDVGRAAIWNYDFDMRIQNHIHKLRSYIPLCTKFFYYVFFLYKHTGLIGGKGIGIQGLSSGSLHKLLIPIPPLEEQDRIVVEIERSWQVL